MDSTRKVTTLFMVVTIITMAILAMSVEWKKNSSAAGQLTQLTFPGLTENLRSLEKITGIPATHILLVKVRRSNGDELTLAKATPEADDFASVDETISNTGAYSTILFANATFLNDQSSADDFVVTGFKPEKEVGHLLYTSFDGLVVEQTVYTDADENIWSRLTAVYDARVAAKYSATSGRLNPLTSSQVKDIANRIDGRTYQIP